MIREAVPGDLKGLLELYLYLHADIARENGCYKAMLLTGAKDAGTLAFYRRAGFNDTDKTAFIQWL